MGARNVAYGSEEGVSEDIAETVIEGIGPTIEAMKGTAAQCAGSMPLALGVLAYCTFVAANGNVRHFLTHLAKAVAQ